MNHFGLRAFTVSVVILAMAVVAVLAGVGRAADASVEFTFRLAPKPVVTSQTNALAAATFDYSGSPSQINNVTLVVDLPAGSSFVSATTAAGSCTASGLKVTCALGSVRSSASKVKVFIVFTAQNASAPVTATANAVVTWNEGNSDGDTGPSHLDSVKLSDSLEVRPTGHSSGAGKCGGADTLSTPPPTSSDPQSTGATYAATSSGEPCTAVSVGEASVANLTCGSQACAGQVSFVTLPELPATSLAQAVVTALNLPKGTTWETVPFFELRDFPASNAITNAIVSCETDATPMPLNQDVCLFSRAKFKSGGQFTFLMVGLGRDPGVVF
jgi:hypothetical protein